MKLSIKNSKLFILKFLNTSQTQTYYQTKLHIQVWFDFFMNHLIKLLFSQTLLLNFFSHSQIYPNN